MGGNFPRAKRAAGVFPLLSLCINLTYRNRCLRHDRQPPVGAAQTANLARAPTIASSEHQKRIRNSRRSQSFLIFLDYHQLIGVDMTDGASWADATGLQAFYARKTRHFP